MNFCLKIISTAFLYTVIAVGANAKSLSGVHPSLVNNPNDIVQMKNAINSPGAFQDEFLAVKASVDAEMQQPIVVPMPKDAGGGYTHEKHKSNQRLIYNAGMMYQLTGEIQYAEHVSAILSKYADMYPTLPIHPKRKEQSPGKLFWQSLNEAVWLVYSIQGYDSIADTLTKEQRQHIENNLFRNLVSYISEESPQTFNRVHNHGTWATAAVGMAGFVLGENEWVEKALYDLEKSGKGGFLRQLDELFSPDGYYNEGPYYQRYALMPFVLFAKAIEVNQPERKIFEYRDGIILKAIEATIQLSYNKLFFPINDAIKDKGIDTIELVYGVTIAYGLNNDDTLLDIARVQDTIVLTGDGLKVARGLDAGLTQPYQYKSLVFRDGTKGDEGGLAIMRTSPERGNQALVLKATAQGMNHGHFDKLNWLFYDNGEEIINDYGAARFLNVEAKYGGHYLKENNTYAKQTISHNTLVVDETSHFNGDLDTGNANHPELLFFDETSNIRVSSANIEKTYDGVEFTRTQALVDIPSVSRPFVIDVLSVVADDKHQYDLPVHFNGHLMDTSFELNTATKSLSALGEKNGYQHLWLAAKGQEQSDLGKITWLNKNRFYSYNFINTKGSNIIFTRTGANDPNFNLVEDKAFITRVENAQNHDFVSVLELHGEYNPSKEFTTNSHSKLSKLTHTKEGDLDIINVSFKNGTDIVLVFNAKQKVDDSEAHSVTIDGKTHDFTGPYLFLDRTKIED